MGVAAGGGSELHCVLVAAQLGTVKAVMVGLQ
jgi:hypothetical protein